MRSFSGSGLGYCMWNLIMGGGHRWTANWSASQAVFAAEPWIVFPVETFRDDNDGWKEEDEGASAVAISSAIQKKNPLTGWLLDYNIELTLSRNRRSSRCESNAYSSVTGWRTRVLYHVPALAFGQLIFMECVRNDYYQRLSTAAPEVAGGGGYHEW